MPTNLPPEYYDIEAQFRAATTAEEKVPLLEEMLSVIPKHKGTDHLRADLRRRLSKLKEEAQARKGGGKHTSAFYVEREGAGQVVLAGAVNVGKSALLAALSNATPEVADYPFTTWTPIPGMMPVDNVQIQLVDAPPLSRLHIEPEQFNLYVRADLILVVVDLQDDPLQQLEDTVAILAEHRVVPAHLAHRYADLLRTLPKPFLVVVNKCDDQSLDGDFAALCELLQDDWSLVPVSAASGRNLEQLKQTVFEWLDIIRVYAKPPGREPDFTAPYVLSQGSTVEDFAGQVHKDFTENLKSARVWGEGVFDGQLVARDHVLHDGDVVELRI